MQTYAVGHGCAADWHTAKNGRVTSVSAEAFPVCETPSITTDIEREDRTPLEIPMKLLAGLVAGEDGMAELSALVGEYGGWIERRRSEIEQLDAKHRPAAE